MKKTTKIESKDIIAVLLDGKLVKCPIEFSEEEGWVDMEIPVQTNDGVNFESGKTINEEQGLSLFDWKTIRMEGTVEVVYANSETTKVK
ncbi:hypothetical protein CMI41_01205 [Candidatus Pacearchaeota archaeon]|nr:hypothetical protein [Candidatus Pacearchaeota archaeon]|tara:strand:- start:11745 stop:12011 length:267 start_codon:yes stop_codon:yes gene_type:complete